MTLWTTKLCENADEKVVNIRKIMYLYILVYQLVWGTEGEEDHQKWRSRLCHTHGIMVPEVEEKQTHRDRNLHNNHW